MKKINYGCIQNNQCHSPSHPAPYYAPFPLCTLRVCFARDLRRVCLPFTLRVPSAGTMSRGTCGGYPVRFIVPMFFGRTDGVPRGTMCEEPPAAATRQSQATWKHKPASAPRLPRSRCSLAMTPLNRCHSEERRRRDTGVSTNLVEENCKCFEAAKVPRSGTAWTAGLG